MSGTKADIPTHRAVDAYRNLLKAERLVEARTRELSQAMFHDEVDMDLYVELTCAIDTAADAVDETARKAGWAESTRQQRWAQAVHHAGRRTDETVGR